MLLRSFLLSASFLIVPAITFIPTQVVASEKSETRSLILSYKGEVIQTDNPKIFAEQLSKGLVVQSSADTVRLHVVVVRDGQAVRLHSSDNVALRKRPGRMKMIAEGALPSADFFEGLALKDFISPKRGMSFPGEYAPEKMAETAFKSVGQTDGIFIVTTFDDMLKGDMTVGLVGFGSWN